MTSRPWVAGFGFLLAAAITASAYWVGLSGPFMLDDPENLIQVARFAAGEVGWIGPVVSNGSGPLGRPLSMLSFVASAAAGGYDPWVFKVGNLALHLSTGALVTAFAFAIFRRDERIGARAELLAVLVGAVWLALPLHVSTVLYAVQRMSQLAALLIVAGMLGYVLLRERLERQQSGTGRSILILGLWVTTMTLAAGHAKENGLLLPLLCAVIELTIFRIDCAASRGARLLTHGILISAFVGGALALALAPDRLLGGYAVRSFTLLERVLTQPRVLWDYIGAMLIPYTPGLGLVQDDVVVSRSLFEPWTTLPALVGWILALGASVYLLRREPVISCGIVLFLVGHLMESTILPLELYFEHRNYFPSVGVLVALGGAFSALGRRLPPASRTFRWIGPALPMAYIAVLWFAVHGRALVWSDAELLTAQAERHRPNALRTQTMLLGQALAMGDYQEARRLLDRYDALSHAVDQGTTNLWRLRIDCAEGLPGDPELWRSTESLLPAWPGPFALKAVITLADVVESGECPPEMGPRLRALLDTWIGKLAVPPQAHAAWRLRYLAARSAATAGDWQAAIDLSTRAWEDSGWNSGIGVMVVQLAHTVGHEGFAKEALDWLSTTAPRWDYQLQEAIRHFHAHQRHSSPERTIELNDATNR